MFGLSFLFTAALWALPLAMLPLVLHLLYRRKSPVVYFSTLRFIKASMQQNAARRKVQRWLLLAIRMLLLALLIWAVAQPAKTLASRFFASGSSSVAAIVVDTSWSMQYRQNQISLLDQADGIVQQLLRNELKEASIILLTSHTPDAQKVPFKSASELLSQWVAMKPEPADGPLEDRVLQAAEILAKQPYDQKLLIVISDYQAREFPRAIAQGFDQGMRVVAMDLHPDRPRSVGVKAIVLNPAQPMGGIKAGTTVDLVGAPGEVRPVTVGISNTDGKELAARPAVMASLDDAGHGQVRFDLDMPAERWQMIWAKLGGEDPMPWDDSRAVAVELPPQQQVNVETVGNGLGPVTRLVKLALDPNQGKLASWPVRVVEGGKPGEVNAVVALLGAMPDAAAVIRWRELANGGGTVVLMLRPGFETQYIKADAELRRNLELLLPSAPYVDAKLPEPLHAVPAAAARGEAAMAGLTSDIKTLELMRATQIVPMTVADAQATRMLLAAGGPTGRAASDRNGMLYLRQVGCGRVFTWACVPDGVNANMGTHPFFLPLLVNQCLRPTATANATNLRLGEVLVVEDVRLSSEKELEIRTPANDVFRVPQQMRNGRRAFVFDNATTPGVYRWYKVGDATLRAVSNVTPPGEESEQSYRAAEDVMPPSEHTLIAHSFEEMQAKVTQVSQPQPKWTLPLGIALILLCAEGLLSTQTGLWTWFKKG